MKDEKKKRLKKFDDVFTKQEIESAEDYYVKMPPKQLRKIKINIKKIEKSKPK